MSRKNRLRRITMAKTIVTKNNTYEVLERKKKIGKGTEPFKLGAGGQGAAFKVKNVKTGKEVVAKLYHDITPPAFNKNLEDIINMTSPHEAFVWPLEILPARPNGAIGFIMDLYDNKVFKKFPDVAIYGTENFKSRRVMINALIEFVSAFEALHAKGRCFQDINEGAIVLDVENGRVRICDCENVAPEGARIPIGYDKNHKEIFMQGFPRYKAPEVEIRAMLPDKYTDRYSIAVMIFMILTRCHPLEGKKRFTFNPEGIVDANVEKDIYGNNPIFIFDDTNPTNRPDPVEDIGAINQWPLIPDFMKELFKKAFTLGMPVGGKYDEKKKLERTSRPTEKEWREALMRWMDTLVPCSNPKCKISFSARIDQATLRVNSTCPKCNHNNGYDFPVMRVFRKRALRRTVLLVPNREIPLSTISNSNSFESAMQVYKGKTPGVYGIKNLTNNTWTAIYGPQTLPLTKSDKAPLALTPTILQNGIKIAFDFDFSAEIKR